MNEARIAFLMTADYFGPDDSDLVECAECGHSHFDPKAREYVNCNVCDCEGQS